VCVLVCTYTYTHAHTHTHTHTHTENTKAGLRWGPNGANVDGKSFDDNYIGKGTTQVSFAIC